MNDESRINDTTENSMDDPVAQFGRKGYVVLPDAETPCERFLRDLGEDPNKALVFVGVLKEVEWLLEESISATAKERGRLARELRDAAQRLCSHPADTEPLNGRCSHCGVLFGVGR